MNTLYASYDLAKERHAELLREANEARKLRVNRPENRAGTLRRLAFALAALSVAAAVTVQQVAAAVGGGGGGGGPQRMF